MNTIDATDARLSTHEAVCAQRYEKINESLDAGKKRMKTIEVLLYITIGAVLLGPGVAAEFVKKVLGL
jgi:uncharacterized membrane protein